MYRLFALMALLATLAACTNPNDLDEAPVDLGDFSLGYNVVVASKMQRGPLSREATAEEWQESLTKAIGDRFGRYQGDRLYHLGVSVEGYVLAQPGIPLVASPNSVLILLLTVWDDAAGTKLNAEPEQITIMETISGATIFGSGVTQSKEVQMENLSRNASKQIENILVRRRAQQGWFGPEASTPPAQTTPAQTAPARAAPAQTAPARAAPAQTTPAAATPAARPAAVAPAATAASTPRIVVAPPRGAILQEPVVAPMPAE